MHTRNLSINSYLQDVRGLRVGDVRDIAITLTDRSTSSTAGVGSGDSYQVPSTHKFFLTRVRGIIDLTNIQAEMVETGAVAPTSPRLAPDLEARILARSLRTTVKLWSKDRSENLTEENRICLASISPMCGGKPLDFDALPQCFMPGETIGFEPQYYGSGPNYVITGTGAVIPYDIGVCLEGILVPMSYATDKQLDSSLASYLGELRNLTPTTYRRVAITMESKSPAAGSNGDAVEVTFRIPSSYRLAIHEIRSHVTFDELELETDVGGGVLASSESIKQRLIGRAGRCFARLKSTDNGNDMEIFRMDYKQTGTGSGGPSLAEFHPVTGAPFDWNDHPHIVQANETMTLSLKWAGTLPSPLAGMAGVVGSDYPNNSRFGITLVGAYVRIQG